MLAPIEVRHLDHWFGAGEARKHGGHGAPATGMSEGSVSDPIRVPGGVMIVALIDKRQALAADPDDEP